MKRRILAFLADDHAIGYGCLLLAAAGIGLSYGTYVLTMEQTSVQAQYAKP
jgi:hypothetical protein